MSVSNHFFDMVIGTNSDTAVSSNHDKASTSTNENETISPDSESVNDESAIKNTMLDPMPGDASRVLVHIMRHGVIFHAQKPNLYHSLCRYQSMIQRHLSEFDSVAPLVQTISFGSQLTNAATFIRASSTASSANQP